MKENILFIFALAGMLALIVIPMSNVYVGIFLVLIIGASGAVYVTRARLERALGQDRFSIILLGLLMYRLAMLIQTFRAVLLGLKGDNGNEVISTLGPIITVTGVLAPISSAVLLWLHIRFRRQTRHSEIASFASGESLSLALILLVALIAPAIIPSLTNLEAWSSYQAASAPALLIALLFTPCIIAWMRMTSKFEFSN